MDHSLATKLAGFQIRKIEYLLMNIIRTCLLFYVISFLSLISNAQPVGSSAIIDINIETIPSLDNPSTGQSENQNFMRIMDGEIKSTIWIKGGLSKTEMDIGFGKSNIYYDAKNKKTTTLFEVMGRKMGFYATDDELKRIMSDSSANKNRIASRDQDEVMIEYISEEKMIAGRMCKKAIIHYKNKANEEKEQLLWYDPGFQLEEGMRFSQLVRGNFVPGIQKLKGFPMEMEIKRSNGNISKFKVNRLDTGTTISDNTFVIPPGYDLRPMSEMNQGGRGRFQMNTEND